MQDSYRIKFKDEIPHKIEMLLFKGISQEAARKGMEPIFSFSLSLEDQKHNILGGVTGTIFYGSLYVDMLWVKPNLRNQGWGTKLITEAEKVGRERDCSFVTLNTMDWEALTFYQKLGYAIEFTREGYANESKMFMLRKRLS